jgi:hypothetical protein
VTQSDVTKRLGYAGNDPVDKWHNR